MIVSAWNSITSYQKFPRDVLIEKVQDSSAGFTEAPRRVYMHVLFVNAQTSVWQPANFPHPGGFPHVG